MRGIVVELQEKRCVILKEDGTFVRRKNRGYAVGRQVQLREAPIGKLTAIAAMLVLLCGLGVIWHKPVGYVYMDINPSIRLEVNRFGRVVNTVPLNADAEGLLENGRLRGSITDCMEDVVLRCRTSGYLSENGDVEVHLYTTVDKLSETVIETAVALERDRAIVSVYEMSEEDHEAAVKYNMPAKRLDAIRIYTECFGGTMEENMEKLKGVSTAEILAKTRAEQSNPSQSNMRYASEQRLKAVKAYTDCFGGTKEENFRLLRGMSTREIWEKVHEKTGKKLNSEENGL